MPKLNNIYVLCILLSFLKVVVYERDEEEVKDNQLWWEDKYGNIRSKLNDYVMDDSRMYILQSIDELHM